MPTRGARFREYPIDSTLAPLVKSIWSLEDDRAIYDAPRQRILPDRCVELVIHLRDPFRNHFANGGNALQPRSFVVGQMLNFLEIEPAGRTCFIAVRFRARAAYLFFSRPLSAVATAVVDLEEVVGKYAQEWTERVSLAQGMAPRVRIIQEILLAAMRRHGRFDRAVDRSLQLIDMAAGQVTVAQLATRLGLSNRQLTRRFENAVGLGPKEFARVSRFRHALQRLRWHPHERLTETALECGYFDQAHFNHEFREFAGMTPREFVRSANVVF